MDHNRVIGKENDIPWRIPRDWQYVRKVTEGHPIILGRKNLESIGRILPGRRNIVLTRDKNFTFNGCEVVHSMKEVFEICRNEKEIFIFGGEQIYNLFLPYTEKMYITRIQHEFEGDTYFPELNYDEWNEVSVKKGITDEENPYTYYFYIYERKM